MYTIAPYLSLNFYLSELLLCSRLLDEIEEHMEKLINMKFKPENRDIDPKSVDANDFDCALCFRLVSFS